VHSINRLTLRFALIVACVSVALMAFRWTTADAQVHNLEQQLAEGAEALARSVARSVAVRSGGVGEAQALRQSLVEEGYEAVLRTGDFDDPIPALLEVSDSHGNHVDLLIGLRGMDPELMNRTRQVRLAEAILEIVGREDFIAMTAFAGGPVDLADARAVIEQDRESLDEALLRRLAHRFGRDAARAVEDLIGGED